MSLPVGHGPGQCRGGEVPWVGSVRGLQRRHGGEAYGLGRTLALRERPGLSWWGSSAPAVGSVEAKVTSPSLCPFGRYGTQNTLSGPFLTSVMGKEAGEREFWQLLRAPDTPLLQGRSGGQLPLDISPIQPCCSEASTPQLSSESFWASASDNH